MSIAVDVRTAVICAGVRLGFSDLTSAAMAPACGAAADVPKNGLNPGAAQETPSAAVTSGCWMIWPPVEEKSPGVIAELSALKKTWRVPSELNVSTTLKELNGNGKGPMAGVAATPNAFAEGGAL